MQANPRTIDELFNSQLRFVVPMFQRLYVWQENPQWQTLWEDIAEKAELQLFSKKSNPHYLGALIIEGVKPSSPREVKRFLIIDGQQRLTTLQLLLCAYRDYSRSKDWKTLDRTTSRYLENADSDVMEKPEEELFKLWPTTLNRSVFTDILSAKAKEVVEEKYPLVWIGRKRKPEIRNGLVEAYLYFYKSIDSWVSNQAAKIGDSEESCAFKLLQALQQDFCVVEISLSEGDDSQEIFYSLNSQGRPLSQSDLLRSLIFMRAEKEQLDRDAIFNDYWNKFETGFWSAEEKRGGRTYSRLDLVLRYFLTVKTGALIDTRRVNEEYKKWISVQPARYPSVRDELSDFSKHARIYEYYETRAFELPSTDLRRVLWDFDVSTAIPLLMYLELEAGLSSEELKECLAIVESFIVRRAFTGEETKEYNKLFIEVIDALKELSGSEVQIALERKLLSGGGTTRHWPTDAEVIERALSQPIFNTLKKSSLRIILERLELSFRGKKTEEHNIPEGLQVEHVMPQQWSTYWLLSGQSIPENVVQYPSYYTKDGYEDFLESIRLRNNKLHTLGNLSLLNQYLNPAASNGTFKLKQQEYGHSVLRLNRYFDGKDDWDESTIEERGLILAQRLCEIWSYPTK